MAVNRRRNTVLPSLQNEYVTAIFKPATDPKYNTVHTNIGILLNILLVKNNFVAFLLTTACLEANWNLKNWHRCSSQKNGCQECSVQFRTNEREQAGVQYFNFKYMWTDSHYATFDVLCTRNEEKRHVHPYRSMNCWISFQEDVCFKRNRTTDPQLQVDLHEMDYKYVKSITIKYLK